MTTTVIIEAHCNEDQRVEVCLHDTISTDTRALKDGETLTEHVYDFRYLTIRERDLRPAEVEQSMNEGKP